MGVPGSAICDAEPQDEEWKAMWATCSTIQTTVKNLEQALEDTNNRVSANRDKIKDNRVKINNKMGEMEKRFEAKLALNGRVGGSPKEKNPEQLK